MAARAAAHCTSATLGWCLQSDHEDWILVHIVTQQGEIGPALHSCAVQCCHLTPAPAH